MPSSAPSPIHDSWPEVDLTVVGGDDERDVVGQHVEDRADEPIGGRSSPV